MAGRVGDGHQPGIGEAASPARRGRELERARNGIKTDLVRGLDTLQGLAGRLLTYDMFADIRRTRPRPRPIRSGHPEALQKWAAQILRSKRA